MKEMLERTIKTLEWMVNHFIWANEQTGLEGDISPELKEAIDLLDELKKENEK